MTEPESSRLPPAFAFQVNDSLAAWNVPPRDWLVTNDKHWDGIASGNLVFNPQGKLLIVQRASHDSMPNKWEVPGGAVDDNGETILAGAARELWEEAGLVATRFDRVVAGNPGRELGQVFTNRHGTKVFCRFTFEVQVESCENVRLDPNEHQDFAWVSEQEVREQRVNGRDIPMTQESVRVMILGAFALRREKVVGSGL